MVTSVLGDDEAESHPESLIRELCTSFYYRWCPEAWFVLFTAYFDESGTHGPAPTITMATLLGSARQWELFERRLKRLQVRYGFTIFHAKDFRANAGEFKGWSADKKARLVTDLTELVRDTLTEGVTTVLPHDRYMGEYRSTPTPKGMTLDSQYGICFRLCLTHLVDILFTTGKRHRLNIIIENGHKNVGDTCRIFDQVKEHLSRKGIELLGGITIARKMDALPLMAADFLSHAVHLFERRQKDAALGSKLTRNQK